MIVSTGRREPWREPLRARRAYRYALTEGVDREAESSGPPELPGAWWEDESVHEVCPGLQAKYG
jgi:hypothetical protein